MAGDRDIATCASVESECVCMCVSERGWQPREGKAVAAAVVEASVFVCVRWGRVFTSYPGKISSMWRHIWHGFLGCQAYCHH